MWLLGPLFNLLAKPFLSYLQAKDNAKRDITLAQIGAEKDQAVALVQAEIAANAQRAGMAHEFKGLIYAIALPYVLHSGAVMLDTTFTFGWGIPTAPGKFAEYEGQILLSFFLVSVAARVANTFRK